LHEVHLDDKHQFKPMAQILCFFEKLNIPSFKCSRLYITYILVCWLQQ